jgi:acyl-coenzyme A thioesterase PaaI-like protein
LASIALTDGGTPVLSLTAAQAADDAKSLLALSGPGDIGVTDTAANVSSRFDSLNANPRLRAIVLTDEGTPALGLNVRQTLDGAAALGAISGPYSVALLDDASAISARFGALNADGRISSIAVSDGNPLHLTVAQTRDDTAALAKIANGSFQVVLMDTAANVAAAGKEPFSQSYVVSIGVSDTAENVAANLDALNTNSVLSEISLTGVSTPVLGVTIAQALNDTVAVGKITGPFVLAVSDTTANILANLDALNLDARIHSIAPTDGQGSPLKLSAQQALANNGALEKLARSNTSIVVTDNAVNVSAGLAALAADPLVSSINVVDTAANILAGKILFEAEAKVANIVVADKAANVSRHIDQLEITGKIGAINLSDKGKPKLNLRVAQAVGAKKSLASISGPYKIEIFDTVANVLGSLAQIEANPAVASIEIVDTPAAIAGDLPTLITIPLYSGYSVQTSSAETNVDHDSVSSIGPKSNLASAP